MTQHTRRILPLLLFFLLCTQLLAQTFTARVIRVLDGDTIAIVSDGTQIRVRLAECDAPESDQPFGSAATQFTASLVSGRSVTVHVTDKDKYGRSIAHITTDQGLDLSTELIRAGLAWWYRQYSRNLQLGFLETQARDAHRGLWIDPNPTPPSVWRHAR